MPALPPRSRRRHADPDVLLAGRRPRARGVVGRRAAAGRARRRAPCGRPRAALWPDLDVVGPARHAAVGRWRAGRAAVRRRPHRRRPFNDEDAEIARAIAHLAAVAIKRAELIEGLTNANIVKDLFEALAAGATAFAATKAAEVRCDLTEPYLIVCAEPAAGREQASGEWRAAAEVLGRDVAELAPRTAVEAGPGPVRALLSLGRRATRADRGGGPRLPRARAPATARRSASASCTGRRRRRARLPRGARRRDDRPGAARPRRRDRLLAGRRLPLPGPDRRRGRAARPDAGRGRPADRLRRASAARRCSTRSSATWPSGAA